MTGDGSTGGTSDRVGSVLAALVRMGYVALVFSLFWLVALFLVRGGLRVAIPGGPVGVASAVGLPPTVGRVPTIYGVVAGVVTTVVWFAVGKDDPHVPL